MAAVYNVPAIFVCENNQYGASTSIKKVIKIENIVERSKAYGIRGDTGDGMNVLDVYCKTKEAVELARSGQGPTLLELKTFRYCGHSRKDPNNYMPNEEKEYWKKKDSIIFFEKILKEEKVLNEERIKQIEKMVEEEIAEAIKYGQEAPEPKPEETYEDVYINMEVPK
jgi:pyruvate dehydrogenase E1 component alpha subunit